MKSAMLAIRNQLGAIEMLVEQHPQPARQDQKYRQGHQEQQVDQGVADVDDEHGPCINAEQPGSWCEVVAIGTQVMNRLGLLIDNVAAGQGRALDRGLVDPARRKLGLHVKETA